MTLVMIYSLLRLAWEKNVLVIGLIKDSAAAELQRQSFQFYKMLTKSGYWVTTWVEEENTTTQIQ